MDQQPTTHLRLKQTVFLLIGFLFTGFLFIGLILSWMPRAQAIESAEFILPPNHQSFYLLEKYNIVVGELKNTLNYQNGTINYTSVATAKGIATLFISEDPEETNILSWPVNAKYSPPKPLSYTYIQGKKHKNNQRMIFSYNDNGETHIEGSYKNKSYQLDTDKTVWNRQFLPFLISSDLTLNPQRTKNTFYLTDKGHIQKYTYTWLNNETLSFNKKQQAVLKFKIVRKGKSRTSFVWISKDHYYLPLKIEQYKDGELNARIILTQLKLNEDE